MTKQAKTKVKEYKKVLKEISYIHAHLSSSLFWLRERMDETKDALDELELHRIELERTPEIMAYLAVNNRLSFN